MTLRHRTLLVLLAVAFLFPPAPMTAQEEGVRNVGDWEIYNRTDPFTDVENIHLTVAVDPYRPVGIEALSLNCDGSDGSLYAWIFHHPVTGISAAVTVRYGIADPRELRGYTDGHITEFALLPSDLADLRATPERLAIRLIDLNEGSGHRASWAALEGTVTALDAIGACMR